MERSGTYELGKCEGLRPERAASIERLGNGSLEKFAGQALTVAAVLV